MAVAGIAPRTSNQGVNKPEYHDASARVLIQARPDASRSEAFVEPQLARRSVVAQEIIAQWAQPQFWATILQAAVSVLGFLAVIFTILQGRAKLSVAQLGLDHSRNEKRPWLDPALEVAVEINIVDGLVYGRLDINLHNRGKTPAQHVRLGIPGIRKRQGPAILESARTAAQAVIDQQIELGTGHVIFPDNCLNFSPLMRFPHVQEPTGQDDPFELVFVLLIVYKWDDGGTGATTAAGAIEPVVSGSTFSISGIKQAGTIASRVIRFDYDDTCA